MICSVPFSRLALVISFAIVAGVSSLVLLTYNHLSWLDIVLKNETLVFKMHEVEEDLIRGHVRFHDSLLEKNTPLANETILLFDDIAKRIDKIYEDECKACPQELLEFFERIRKMMRELHLAAENYRMAAEGDEGPLTDEEQRFNTIHYDIETAFDISEEILHREFILHVDERRNFHYLLFFIWLSIIISLIITGIIYKEKKKRMEEKAGAQHKQLIQVDKMASLGVLYSGVMHEINNSNTFIILNISLFSEAWDDAFPILEKHYKENGEFYLGGLPYTQFRQETPELFADIQYGLKRIKDIAVSLKDFSRQGDADEWKMVDINEILGKVTKLLNNMIKKSTLHFTSEYAPHLPLIKGKFHELEQVMVNLISNACQSLPDNTRGVSVSTSLDKDSQSIIVKVEDQGIGISMDNMRKITDPFFTTKKEVGGTGLGLSISREIIQGHNGSLSFTSEVGKGTTAIVTFPVVSGDI